ncbi:MAG: hypothetical protein FJ295_01305 [Planctomycetes bacterium]|nr:hypothetical protein [Planctomycetota bacterium]
MTMAAHEIESIVRAVVARLREGQGGRVEPTSVSQSTMSAAPELAGGTLRLTGRLVTVATIAGRLDGVRQLELPAGAVVTPAVRDQLRQRNIPLRFTQTTAPAASPPITLYVHRTDPACSTDRLATSLGGQATLELLTACPVEQAVAELAAVLTHSASRGLLMTRGWAEAQGLANRWSSVRAFAAFDARMVQSARRDWNANLMVIDPGRSSQQEILHFTREFLRCESAK